MAQWATLENFRELEGKVFSPLGEVGAMSGVRFRKSAPPDAPASYTAESLEGLGEEDSSRGELFLL